MATFYLDFEGGNDSNDGTTFANRWKTITSGATAARTAPGDVIRIMKSPDPVSLGVNGTFTKQSPTITLASAVTANISLCQAAWTASANVTTTTSTTRKEGTLSTSIAPAAAFTTGLLAYEATGTLDLSAYQNVTFWIRTSSAVSANVLRLDLCSDTAGATPVHSITIDSATAANVWKPVTWKNGSALSSSIQSVALTALSDPGTPTILIDNILATNDLHFGSLIGTSSSATSLVWYPIKSINGTAVIIGASQNELAATTARGWHDTTTTTTAYVRSAIRLTTSQTVQESGDASARITYSGGWDRTAMTTQNGISFLQGDFGTITSALSINNQINISVEYIAALWANSSIASIAATCTTKNIAGYGTTDSMNLPNGSYGSDIYSISSSGTYSISGIANNVFSYSNTANGVTCSTTSVSSNITCLNNSTHGISVNAGARITNVVSRDNGSSGISITSDGVFINGVTTSGNSTGITANGVARLNNLNLSEATPISQSSGTTYYAYISRFSPYKGVIYSNGSIVVQDSTAQLHGAASISWKHDPTTAHTTDIPVDQPLQPFAVAASSLVTFKIWVYRTSTNVEGRVRLRGYITPGVDADVTATITAAINTWQELTVTCTPSAAGVVQIDLESYSVNGSTGTVYFGDATVSQA